MTESTNSGKARIPEKLYNQDKPEVKPKKEYYDRQNYITLISLYLHYPHLWQEWGKSVPYPYIKKEELSSHEYRLTFKQWQNIVLVYFKHVIRYMIRGYLYKLNAGLGYISVEKRRRTRRKLPREDKQGWKRDFDRTVDGYALLFHWNKRHTSQVQFAYKAFYKMKLTRPVFKGILKACRADRSILYRLKNARYADE